MKKKSLMKYIVPMLLLIFAVTAWFGVRVASGAVQHVKSIEAFYTGEAVEVGKEIKLKDIYLNAEYYIQDGQNGYSDYVEVKKGFTITPSVIKNKGTNRIVVTYGGKKCTLEVPGKAVESISASYSGEEVYVGAAVPVGKIEVYAYFSDGSMEKVKDFTLSTKTVTKEGVNSIPVVYKGKTEYIQVYGKAPLAAEDIFAEYTGDNLIAGNPINKKDIKVTVYYNDGTSKEITNFNISPSIVKEEGENEITVSYGDVSTTIYLYGEERYITDMRVTYVGPGVLVGRKVSKDDFEVIVTYNDKSEEQTEEFEIYGEQIVFEGDNMVLIYCDSFSADVVVPGVKGFAANYDNAIAADFVSADYQYSTRVTLGMNLEVEAGKFSLGAADDEIVEAVVKRIMPTEEFIGYELIYDDDEMVIQFPMAMKVSVPDGFDTERFGVYYTPNKSTIMVKVDGEFTDEEAKTEYEFVAYEPGLYVVVNEVTDTLVSEIIVEEELELKINRSFALNPIVFPLSAENKELVFSSSDEDVATVSENGKIRTHSEGECEILIETTDGSDVYVIVNVEVTGRK